MWRRVLSSSHALARAVALPAPATAAALAETTAFRAPLGGLLAAQQFHPPSTLLRAATREDALSSGKAPTSSPPDSPIEASQDFERLADQYLGGLWDKLEAGLRSAPGEGKSVDVEIEREGMQVLLPEGGKIVISKDPAARCLVVHSNLHDFYGSDGAPAEMQFRLQRDHTWETDGEELHQFLEDGLAKHLKVQVDLEPDAQTQYGPDPT